MSNFSYYINRRLLLKHKFKIINLLLTNFIKTLKLLQV